jgi:FKBP-type peptidyl-prolyl cis-trans isomerase 2
MFAATRTRRRPRTAFRPSLDGLEDRVALTGAATQLAVTVTPNPVVAMAPMTVTVTAEDAAGHVVPSYNGTIAFVTTDDYCPLNSESSAYTFVPSDGGIHTFTTEFEGATTDGLITATDVENSAITGTSAGIHVLAGPVARLWMAGEVAQTAGQSSSFQIAAVDAYGNINSNYTGTIHFTSSDSKATLPADTTFTAGNTGFLELTATLKTAGRQSLTATDTSAPGITGTIAEITINPAAASTLAITGPSTATAGERQSFVVTAEDAYGNVATGYRGTVHFTSSDPQAALPPNDTFTADDAGTHTFAAAWKKAGHSGLTVTDTSNSTLAGQATLEVVPGPTRILVISGPPASVTAGTPNAFTATAEDAYGNVTPDYAGTVHVTSTDANAILPADTTFAAGNAGVHRFDVTLETAGTEAIRVRDTAHPTITGLDAPIPVAPGSARHFLVTSAPAVETAGTQGRPTVTAYDAYGNVATGYTGTVHFTSNDTHAVLPANITFTAGDAGVRSFSEILKTAGPELVRASDTVHPSITGLLAIQIVPAATRQFVVSGLPATTSAGASDAFTVTAEDLYGNVTPGYTGTVVFTSTDTHALLPSAYTFTTADAGMHIFDATFGTVGLQALRVSDAVHPSIIALVTGLAVTPGVASKIAITGPQKTGAGQAQQFLVTVEDTYGNVVTNYAGTVAFTSTDPRAALPPAYTFSSTDKGTHAITATFETPGFQGLRVTGQGTSPPTGKIGVFVI